MYRLHNYFVKIVMDWNLRLADYTRMKRKDKLCENANDITS